MGRIPASAIAFWAVAQLLIWNLAMLSRTTTQKDAIDDGK